MGTHEEMKISEGFTLHRFENKDGDHFSFEQNMELGIIQFYFAIRGNASFSFNQGNYTLPLKEDKAMILYNPEKKLPVHLNIEENSWVLAIFISITKFHGLFSSEAEFIGFLNEENKNKKYYAEEAISPSMAIVLNQIFNNTINPSLKNLYLKGKTYELLSLFFNRNEDQNAENCPFLSDEDDVMKIKNAKDIIIQRMTEPPTLQDLADEVGVNIKKLKLGFKQIYGDTVYGFLFNYKMEYARKLLDQGSYNVTEVGLKIGYSSASHFIAAFKKKYGTTPKKYLMSITQNL